jgi:hypothetical protein
MSILVCIVCCSNRSLFFQAKALWSLWRRRALSRDLLAFWALASARIYSHQSLRPDLGRPSARVARATSRLYAAPFFDAAWRQKLAALRACVAAHGRLPPQRDATGLGAWVNTQRKVKRAMEAGGGGKCTSRREWVHFVCNQPLALT